MNTDDKRTEDIFKSAFENFEVSPPGQNWEEIAEALNREKDEDFRAQLQPLSATPPPHVWENIQKELPLHSGMRRYFSWMNKIAVVLVIGMLLSILSDQNRPSIPDQNRGKENESLTTVLRDLPNSSILRATINSGFVFDITKKNIFRKQPHQFSCQQEAYIKNLLQYILDDNDNLAIHTDSTIISNSLSPAKAPHAGDALAQANQNTTSYVPDLQISIPLIVVENEAEAERLIEIYDANHDAAIIEEE